MYGARLLFGAGVPAPGNPRGMLNCAQVMSRFCARQLPGSSSLRSPVRIFAVGTTLRNEPGSTFCRWISSPAKKNALSRFRLKSRPGRMMGPPRLPPGYWNELFGFSVPVRLFDRSFAANFESRQ